MSTVPAASAGAVAGGWGGGLTRYEGAAGLPKGKAAAPVRMVPGGGRPGGGVDGCHGRGHRIGIMVGGASRRGAAGRGHRDVHRTGGLGWGSGGDLGG